MAKRLSWSILLPMSAWCAGAVLRADRSSYHSRRPSRTVLKERIREITQTRVRYVYRGIHVPLQREGRRVNAKRVYPLYCEEGLQLCNKMPKRRASAKKPAMH